MRRRPRISVVIPTRDRPLFLRRTLACLAVQDLPGGDYEVIVVNDGGDRGTAAAARAYGRRMKLRYLSLRAGNAGAARNLGARRACGDIILFMDDECLSVRTFLAAHLRAHGRAGRPVVVRGPTGPVLAFWDKSVFGGLSAADSPLSGKASGWLIDESDILREGFKPEFPLVSRKRFYDQALQAFGRDLEQCPAPWPLFLTRNVSLARSLWESSGGFDENLPGAGLEDLELGYRLHKSGAPFRLEPQACCHWQLCAFDKESKARRLADHYRLICGKHRDMDIFLVWKLIAAKIDFAAFNRSIAEFRRLETDSPSAARARTRRAETLARRHGQSAKFLLGAL